MGSDRGRLQALRDLVELRRHVPEALAAVSGFPWDSTIDLVIVQVGDVRRALDAFEAGLLIEADLCDWAEAVQGRDDLALDPSHRDALADALFQLSTPELHGTMADIVQGLRHVLAFPRLP